VVNLKKLKKFAAPLALLAFAAVCGAAFAMRVALREQDLPAARLVQGAVTIADGASASASVPLRPSRELHPGDTIRTGAGAWAIFELPGKYRVKIHPSSEVVLDQVKPHWLPGKTVLHLSQGEVLVSIGEEEGLVRYPLEVLTPIAFARALGTQFAVRASPDAGGASVQVLRGAVQAGSIASGAARASIHAGEEVRIAGGFLPIAPSKIAGERLRELSELFQFGRNDQAILLIGMGPDRVDELLKPCAIYLKFETNNESALRMMQAVREIQQVKPGDREAHLPAVRALEAASRLRPRENRMPPLLFTAAYYDYAGSPADAVRIFKELAGAYQHSAYRSLALMAGARIQARTGDKAGARVYAGEILASHPRSPEAEPAARLLKQLLQTN
jgi:ferric-dicitrate binding protein FerR (iron transport regulator)